MKRKMLGLMLLGIAGSALAVDRVDLDNRIRTLTAKFEALQREPAKAIPAETLAIASITASRSQQMTSSLAAK